MEYENNNFLSGVEIPISASMMPIAPRELTSDSFITPEDEAIIPNSGLTSSFAPTENVIEFYAYDAQKNIISRNYDFKDWRITQNSANTEVPTNFINDQGLEVFASATGSIPTDYIEVNPPLDLYNLGFDNGEVYALYNFINYELSSSIDNTYYISEISGDRTEVRIKSNTISNGDIRSAYKLFRQQFNSQEYFDEFYLGLFDNRYEICTNILLEQEGEQASILLKLYNELDSSISTGSQVYVATKVGETVSYKVKFEEDFRSFIDNATYIKGPNINIPLQDLINNSTTLKNKEELLNSPSSASVDSVLNILNQTGVTLTPNYSYDTFEEFVNFSSAKERLNNFVEKVTQIQSHEADISALTTVTGSNSTVAPVSQSLALAQSLITTLVENFDGYENYLYYNSSSFAYPKTGSHYPYPLLPTTDQEVVEWIGSDVEGSQYYGGYILSASLYDEDNQNYLYYTIPTFITENGNNDDYTTFSNMVGQSFDEVWMYTKALSERYNTTNDPEKGLPLDLAADAIKSLGFETFGNNYDNQDNFIGLAGENNGIYTPPTGSELITDYIAVNGGNVMLYWDYNYSWADYVQEFIEYGWPYAIDKVSKEIYKRLYHNMAYLTKKKGTISGLRQLINVWGIPNTILRINEFGGKNRDNTDDYDLWYNRYSYTYTPVAANNFMASSSVKVPWMPLLRNKIVADNPPNPIINPTTIVNQGYSQFLGGRVMSYDGTPGTSNQYDITGSNFIGNNIGSGGLFTLRTIANNGAPQGLIPSSSLTNGIKYFIPPTITGANTQTNSGVLNGIDSYFTVTGGGVGGEIAVYSNLSGGIDRIWINSNGTIQRGGLGYTTSSIITITAAQLNAINGTLGNSMSGADYQYSVTSADLQDGSPIQVITDNNWTVGTTSSLSIATGAITGGGSGLYVKFDIIGNVLYNLQVADYGRDGSSLPLDTTTFAGGWDYNVGDIISLASSVTPLDNQHIPSSWYSGNNDFRAVVLKVSGSRVHELGIVQDGSTGWSSASKLFTTPYTVNSLNDPTIGVGFANELPNNSGPTVFDITTVPSFAGSGSAPAYVVPDGVALRFKAPKGPPSSSYGGSFYSQSIIVKKSNGTSDSQMDWGISLFYEDQPTGSYSGSSFSDYYNYGKLRFYMSASQADGGVQVSDDIYLPFFDGGWWSVLLQRDQHVSAADDSLPTTYTMFAANKQDNYNFHGWQHNSLGFSGSVSMSSAPIPFNSGYGGGFYDEAIYNTGTGSIKTSLNNAWNSYGVTNVDGVYVGGYISGSDIMTEISNENGKIFSGSFQEFRYYSNNISKEVFNDFVMNPESIEGNNITGSESSFDIVNFRAPLGNELEEKFIARWCPTEPCHTSGYNGAIYDDSLYNGPLEGNSFTNYISSSHPAVTGSAVVVITGSFYNPATGGITSSYDFIEYGDFCGIAYSKTNVETYFLDQPSIGIRNRVSNKIQVEDGDAYGKVLSKYQSIDQNYLISQSYTEDITSLEVGFSPQDEVNDDIIATFGYGAVSSVIADPRFFFDSQDDYYPKLRQISEEYFKKYTTGNIQDYLRLIKYFDNSLFKAIKSYVPARTSVTTGVIIKQNMLERNRVRPVRVNPNTIIAYTPETGSIAGDLSPTETGMNSAISYRNIEITGSINIGRLSGLHGNVPPNLKGKVSASGAGFNIVPVTQSWNGAHETVAGLINFTDSSSVEFYNGEYSGSTIVVTSQSLQNNPYTVDPNLDINYTVAITSSTGQFSYTYASVIDTYPSFSMCMEFYTKNPAEDYWKDNFDSWAAGQLTNATGSVWLSRDPLQHDRFYIDGIQFPNIASTLGSGIGSNNSQEPGNAFGLSHTSNGGFFNNWQLAPRIEIPLPPREGSGLTSIESPPESASYVATNTVGPYFKMNISGSINSADHPDAEFMTRNPLMGDLDDNIIISTMLGPNNIIEKTAGYINNASLAEGLCKYWYTDAYLQNARYVSLVDSNGNPQPFPNPVGVFTGSIQMEIRISNYDAFNSGANFAYQVPYSLPAIGSASLNLIGSTWTGSYSDYGVWSPLSFVINERSLDPTTGLEIDNTDTLLNGPNFNFDFTNYGGTPESTPVTFLANNQSINGIVTYQNVSYLSSVGFRYTPLTSQQFTGSSGAIGSSITDLFSPTGSQDTQTLWFDPTSPSQTFYNSNFNPLINNVSESIDNDFIQVVEYADGPIPSNFDLIVNRTAKKAQIPDSFYTQKASILPRYVGSTLESANYNTYTPSGSITFLNNITGSATQISGSGWGGDRSFGKTSVIDSHPIYMAHFKNSKENYELFDTYTFRIDSLIQVPLTDVKGNKAPETPIVIKIDGSGDNLSEVRSTFEVNRSASIAYNSSKFRGIKYSSLKVGNGQIYQGALEYQNIFSTQPSPTEYIMTASFQTSSWTGVMPSNQSASYGIGYWNTTKTGFIPLTEEGSGSWVSSGFGNSGSFGSAVVSSSGAWMSTGSNALYFRGGMTFMSSSALPFNLATTGSNPATADPSGFGIIAAKANNYFYGSSLAMLHNYNKYIQYKIVASGSLMSGITGSGGDTLVSGFALPGYPSASNFQFNTPENYSYLEYSGSTTNPTSSLGLISPPLNLLPYENFDQPFLVNKNDEIRVTYNSNIGKGAPVFQTKTFTVISAEGNTDYENGIYPFETSASIFALQIADTGSIGNATFWQYPVTGSERNYDKLIVHPDPSQVFPPIEDGKIFNFTIRRRINADDRVIIYQTAPSGSKGAESISGEGYIIPKDFSAVQKRNAQTLINQLSAKNAFRATEDPPNLRE